MSEHQHPNRAARRRADRAAAKGHRQVHAVDRAGVLSQLVVEASAWGVNELIELTDLQLAGIELDVLAGCRRLFDDRYSMAREDMTLLTLVVVTLSSVWATSNGRDDEAAYAMTRRCGVEKFTKDFGQGMAETSFGVLVGSNFSSISMLLANRVALIE